MSTYFLINCITMWSALVALSVLRQRKTVSWGPLLLSVIGVSIPFILWDIIATARGDWSFSSVHTFPFRFVGIPIEEILFFPTTAFACISIMKTVEIFVDNEKTVGTEKTGFVLLGVLLILLSYLVRNHFYTVTAFLFLAVTFIVAALIPLKFLRKKSFWLSILWTYIPFFIINTVLTAIPIVNYSQSSILGVRLGTIPIEDFIFNFLMVFWYFGTYIENDTITHDSIHAHE